ncbi:TonB-dependent receptor [Fluviicola sp.]|uniref:TonB-dependent receptor n=1 Tax=Fluviicola sp. TaxID=1917219 RepID=UPI0031D08037
MQGHLIKHFLLVSILTSVSLSLFAQRQYTFNAEGNRCYFNYVCYAPNSNYSNVRRPFVFVLADEYEDPMDVFKADKIKDQPQFYNYLFIYVPNKYGSNTDKLECLESLTSLITFGYAYGHTNVFLRVLDPVIKQTDIDLTGLNKTYKSVQLFEGTNKTLAQDDQIAEDFKEDTEAYGAIKVDDRDQYGTFYVEDEKNEAVVSNQKAVKTYFGPPNEYDFTLTGIVKDRSTGEALPFSTIQIKGTQKGGSSNADGYYTIQQVPSDTVTLIVSYVGFEKTEVFLSPAINKKHFVIELVPTTQELQTVTITGIRQDVVLSKREDVSVIKMTPKKLEQLPNLGERDVMRSFQLMPGVSASNESSSGLYVRGGTPDQNLVLYDGFTVYHVDHLYGFFSAFNSNALKDVQLYKGGFESRFGGRLSSVTEITGKEGNQKKFNMGGDFSLLSMNVFAEIPVGKKFSSVIAFRRSYKGPIYDKIFEKFNTSSSTTTEQTGGGGGFGGNRSQQTKVTSFFYDLNGKFTYKPTTKDIISFSIFNGTDKLDNSSSFASPSFGNSNSNFSMSSTDLTKYGNIGSSLKWSRKWSDKLYGNTILSYSNYYSDRDKSQTRTVTNSDDETTTSSSGIFENNDLKDYSFKSDYEWNPSDFSQLQFGVFATYFDIDYTYAQNDTTTVLDKHNRASLSGAYVQNKFKFLRDRIQFVPGIRASYFETTNKFYFEPRASVTVNLTDKLTLKGATGKYYQFANRVTREDILSGSKDFWLLSDGNSIPVSSAVHYIAGLSYETQNYLFSTEGYYKQISNLTEYSLRFNTSPGGVSYDENFFTGNGYSKGVEFLVQKKSGKLNGWVSYTLGQARNKFAVYSDGYFPANQDVTHEFKAVLMYKYKRWDFSVTWIYATGRPYTAPSGAYTVTLLDGSTQDFFTVTTKNGLRLPDYHRCDMAINYKLLGGVKGDKKRREIGYVGFSVFNLYNRINTWYKQYSIEDGQVIETNVNYLGFTPNVTLSLKLR